MTLNVNFQVKSADKSDKINKVQEKKTKKILTMEEAWQKIASMKNSESDKAKLREVFVAFKEGKIGREIGSEGKSFSKAEALRLWVKLQESNRVAKLEELAKNTPDNYHLVLTKSDLNSMWGILKKDKLIAVDTETTGLNLYGKDHIVGVSFTSPTTDNHYYIPLAHDEKNVEDIDYAMTVIKDILGYEDKGYILANACFDMHQFANYGIEIKGKIYDVIEIMKLLNENEPTYRLKDLVTKYLKMPSDTFDVLFGKNCKFNTVPLKYARYYACKDTHVTWLLYEFEMKYLPQFEGVYEYYKTVEQPLTRVVFEMEREGFLIDFEEVESQKAFLEAEIPRLEKELKVMLGDINFGSPKQLLEALQKNVSKDIQSTGKDDLKAFSSHPAIKTLQEWKANSKHLSGFVGTIESFIQPDGKLHGRFNPNGARTGRFSSTEPNLQQQPYEARKMYKVDDDSLILGMDFSAQEPRMLTHYTQEPVLIENYNKGLDLYATLASEFYGKPYEECYKTPDDKDTKERKTFKVVVLAIMYGMGAKTLGASLGITTNEAQAILDKFKATFPNIAKFTEENTVQACKQGFVEMVLEIDGKKLCRKRRLPFFKGENPRSVYDTYSTNAKIQGTSAMQTKLCMIKGYEVCKRLSSEGRRFSLLATIHDEVLFKVPKDITIEEVEQLEAVMTQTVKLKNVPSKTDSELGRCWGNLSSKKEWFSHMEG